MTCLNFYSKFNAQSKLCKVDAEQTGHLSKMDEIWIIRNYVIDLNEFWQSGQLSNLDALRVAVERPLYTTFTVFKNFIIDGLYGQHLPNLSQY